MFNPENVVLVGASEKPNAYGRALLDNCVDGGFSGSIYPVNARAESISGRKVFSSLADLPEPPDHVVLSVANDSVEKAVAEALAIGAGALTLFAELPDRRLRDRIGAMVREAGAILCGPNSMGLHNITNGLRLTPFPVPLDLAPGGVGLITQSGSIMGALAHNDRRLRFSQLVSTGSESALTAADYLVWMLRQPETRTVGMFLETVRDPDSFIAAMEGAAERDIPVVILKVGRSEAAARMAVSHTGALVGDDAVFRALVLRLGGHMVDTVDELAATLQVFAQDRRVRGSGIVSIHDSGGERELLADLADDLGVPFAKLSEATLSRIDEVTEPGIEPDNPLDAWSTGQNAEQAYADAMTAMMADPATAAGLYVLDWRQDYYLHEIHERALCRAAASTDKPIIAVSNYSMTVDPDLAARLADSNVPLLKGTREAVLAMRALLARGPTPPFRKQRYPEACAQAWREKLRGRRWISEPEAYALLTDYGIVCPAHDVASSPAEAHAAASRIGFPLVLKAIQPGLAHKTEQAGVHLGLATIDQVTKAYADLTSRFGPDVLVAEMINRKAEWTLGAVIDPSFGPAIRMAPGGVMVDLIDEHALLMAPFTADEALAALEELRMAKTLDGFRGSQALVKGALCDAASKLSHLAWDLADILTDLEINPIAVNTDTAVAVDALIVTN
ncbi:MAG: acetate--CoA ligase family protein [Pseudomonadota bacterium]